jgi:hypothetical protein
MNMLFLSETAIIIVKNFLKHQHFCFFDHVSKWLKLLLFPAGSRGKSTQMSIFFSSETAIFHLKIVSHTAGSALTFAYGSFHRETAIISFSHTSRQGRNKKFQPF